MGLTIEESRFDLQHGQDMFFFSVGSAVTLGAHQSYDKIGTAGSFPAAKAAGGMKLTTQLHLVPRYRMHGAVPPLPYTSWRSDIIIKRRDKFTCKLNIIIS
jgi:hypothetical protein